MSLPNASFWPPRLKFAFLHHCISNPHLVTVLGLTEAWRVGRDPECMRDWHFGELAVPRIAERSVNVLVNFTQSMIRPRILNLPWKAVFISGASNVTLDASKMNKQLLKTNLEPLNQKDKVCTGWPFWLRQTCRWHQNKRSVLVHGPHTKTEVLFWFQWEVWHNQNGHPVCQWWEPFGIHPAHLFYAFARMPRSAVGLQGGASGQILSIVRPCMNLRWRLGVCWQNDG